MYANKGAFTEGKLSVTIYSNTSTTLGNAALSTSRSPMYVNKADFTKEKLNLTIFP